MSSPWQPYREPLRVTLTRTIAIAVVVGALLAWRWGGVTRWPLFTLLVLWPSFGGHWVELGFLNWIRPRLPATRVIQGVVRIMAWFVGGAGLAVGVYLTAMALAAFQPARWPTWWIGGLAFIGIELVAQGVLQLRGHPSFYNGRG